MDDLYYMLSVSKIDEQKFQILDTFKIDESLFNDIIPQIDKLKEDTFADDVCETMKRIFNKTDLPKYEDDQYAKAVEKKSRKMIAEYNCHP